MMKAVNISEMLVNLYQTTWCNTAKDSCRYKDNGHIDQSCLHFPLLRFMPFNMFLFMQSVQLPIDEEPVLAL
jgi:hypothetical protein